MTHVVAVIGLGSNLNRPLLQLRKACKQLQAAGLEIIAYSSIYQSKPLITATSALHPDYLNAAVAIKTNLAPQELLRVLKKIERDMGREVVEERWAPRVIDLDILVFGDITIHEANLIIPHKELPNRSFALLPLQEVLPTYKHSCPMAELPKKLPYLLHAPQIMGILNVTPDSFADGGLFLKPEVAIAQAEYLFASGADIIDIGAESTRPSATSVLVDSDVEWQRLQPVLELVQAHWQGKQHRPLISSDTRRAETVEKALTYGIDWINDQSQAEFEAMVPLIKQHQLHYVAMHHCGLPASPDRVIEGDVVETLKNYQQHWLELFAAHGLDRDQLIVDPGIGFGKTVAQQATILGHTREIRLPNVAYLVGHSRKSFIKGLLTDPDAAAKEMITAMISAQLARDGVDYIRVHAPKINLDAIAVARILSGLLV